MESNVQIEVVKVINVGDTYTAKNGKKYTNINYYLVVNGTWVAIRPSFSGGYKTLDVISRVVKNSKGTEDEHKK